MKLYIASPFGFSEAARLFYEQRFIPRLIALGFEVLDPWVLTAPAEIDAVSKMPEGTARRAAFAALNARIGKTNADAIDRCDGVVAVLDGADVDSGTAAEIGYACARGKPIVGYRGDFRLSADNEGAIVNLQVEYFIRASGGTIVKTLDELAGVITSVLGGGRSA